MLLKSDFSTVSNYLGEHTQKKEDRFNNMKQVTILVLMLVALAGMSHAFGFYGGDNDNSQFYDQDSKRALAEEQQNIEQEKREAVEFFKRLFHPFSTKNEEIKRETREVYEEKCESVVPTQRFCPELKTW